MKKIIDNIIVYGIATLGLIGILVLNAALLCLPWVFVILAIKYLFL